MSTYTERLPYTGSPEYDRHFWNAMRGHESSFDELSKGYSTGIGLYALPNSSDNKYMAALEKESLFRGIGTVIKAYGLAVQAANWDMVGHDKKSKIESDLTKLASKTSLTNEPHVSFKTKFIFNIMKMMHAKGWDSSHVEKQYWQELGWLGKSRPWNKPIS